MVRQIESTIETYTLLYANLGSQWKFAVCCRELTSGTLGQPRRMVGGGRESQEGGDTCTPMTDSC